jgi:hypothetical protein
VAVAKAVAVNAVTLVVDVLAIGFAVDGTSTGGSHCFRQVPQMYVPSIARCRTGDAQMQGMLISANMQVSRRLQNAHRPS